MPFKAGGRKTTILFIFHLILILFLIPSPGLTEMLLQVVLRDSRQIIWGKTVSPGEQFFLIHRNSIYDSLVWEAFLIDNKGVIWLKRIKTSSPAVLEYYGLEDFSSDWIGLSRKVDRIPMLITRGGEVCLEIGNKKVFLSALLPDGSFIEIRTLTLN